MTGEPLGTNVALLPCEIRVGATKNDASLSIERI